MDDETKVNSIDQKRIDAFQADLKEMVKKHNLDLAIKLNYTANGIFPSFTLVEVENKAENKG